jgi:hypothetical protein
MKLPWQPIENLTPKLGGDKVFVWNGEAQFSYWKYGWSPSFDTDPDEPRWCEDNGSIALEPQPTHYLPLVPPGVDIDV